MILRRPEDTERLCLLDMEKAALTLIKILLIVNCCSTKSEILGRFPAKRKTRTKAEQDFHKRIGCGFRA